MPKAKPKPQKIFVLDTSVLLHDHHSVNNFHEHDVALPITVLEELDQFKKGNDSLNFEAREFIRFLEALSGKGEYLENNYSVLIITGSTNFVFTGIPLLMAGLTLGKLTKRIRSMLSIFIVS